VAWEAPAPISAGDFVRSVKQLIDLLRQLASAVEDEAVATSAEKAAGAPFRGVIAASSVVAGDGRLTCLPSCLTEQPRVALAGGASLPLLL
jgi:hypothetical protein